MTSSDGELVLVTRRIGPIDYDGAIAYYDDEVSDDLLEQTVFFVPRYEVTQGNLPLMERMPRLQVCQLLTAGFEFALALTPSGVTLCNAAGVHDAGTAELAVGLILARLRGIDTASREMATGTWGHKRLPSLADRRVLIIGAGGVGRAVAARLAPFETDVVIMGRTAREGVRSIDDLSDVLPWAEVVVIAVPLDDSTRHLVDSAFLARMSDGALLVNVARGPVVDTDALLAELSSGRITAGLDVTDPEPLPANHGSPVQCRAHAGSAC